ncbi:MAG TPA: hypothetical protein PLQ00_08035, partial [Thermoguttaceae bacterium]|nr:hypothetical protein [Thermoguttaceae bacterium]
MFRMVGRPEISPDNGQGGLYPKVSLGGGQLLWKWSFPRLERGRRRPAAAASGARFSWGGWTQAVVWLVLIGAIAGPILSDGNSRQVKGASMAPAPTAAAKGGSERTSSGGASGDRLGPSPTETDGAPWPDGAWPMERVDLTNGESRFGLIESVDEQWVHLVEIKRRPGRPASLVVRPIERSAVAGMVRLPESEREQLQERTAALAFRAQIEAAQMEAIGLDKRIQNSITTFSYSGRWFQLETDLPEEITRRVVVRLEQVFSAYRQLLPPRRERPRALRIRIFSSRMEYEDALRRYDVRLANPAVFLPKENWVLAGADLGQFAAQLNQLNQEHGRLRQELSQLRRQAAKKLEELGRKLRQEGVPRQEAAKTLQRERALLENQISQKMNEIQRVDRKNAELFSKIMQQTLRQLYHEAFHAYMENYLFPSKEYQTPLWLQEGLAMLFQEGVLEADTLRIDAPSEEAATAIRLDR